MKEKLSFNQWLLYYGDDIEYMLDQMINQAISHNSEDKLLNNNIYYKFAKLIYYNSYKGRPIHNI